MSSLNPPPPQTPNKTVSRSSSAASLKSGIEQHNDLQPVTHARRDSASSTTQTKSAVSASPGAPQSAAAQAGLLPLPSGSMQAKAENEALITPVDWAEPDHLKTNHPGSQTHSAVTEIYVGKDKKAFHVPTATLKEKSPYFKKMLAEETGHDGKPLAPKANSFDDLNEFSMALFMHWLEFDGKLNGPSDFHSLAHYLSLYVLAKKFQIESLENQGEFVFVLISIALLTFHSHGSCPSLLS